MFGFMLYIAIEHLTYTEKKRFMAKFWSGLVSIVQFECSVTQIIFDGRQTHSN